MSLKIRLLLIPLCVALLAGCNVNPKAAAKVQPQEPEVAKAEDTPPNPDEPVVPPEVVQLRDLQVSGEIKTLTVSNAAGEYHLSCNRKAVGCESPSPGKAYLLFNNRTRYRLPGAQSYMDLAFIQNWTVTYNQSENVGLVPDKRAPGFRLGLYMLDSWKATSGTKKPFNWNDFPEVKR